MFKENGDEISFRSGYTSGWVGVMVERRQFSQNSCQVSIFMEENLLQSKTFSCTNSAYTATSLRTATRIYVGDQNYSGAYGNHCSTRFLLL